MLQFQIARPTFIISVQLHLDKNQDMIATAKGV